MFLDIQLKLDKSQSLYLSNFKSEFSFSKFDMKGFILLLLVSLSENNTTILSNTDAVYCEKSKRRSLGDIYRICKYYYDNVTLKEVQYWLAILYKEKKIGFFYCNSNKKRVYMNLGFYNTHSVNPIHYASPDEYGIPIAEINRLAEKNIEDII